MLTQQLTAAIADDTPRDGEKNYKNWGAVTKSRSLLFKHKLDGASRDMMNDSFDKNNRNVADSYNNKKNILGNYNFNRNNDELIDDDETLNDTNANNKKKGGHQHSETVNTE